MEYDYIPLPKRNKLSWPDGAHVAVVLTFNLETWDITKPTSKPYYAGGPSILPDILPGDTPDFPNYTWREYGQRVGLWRLYELFDSLGVRASCTTNAVTFDRRREMVDACLERGWELLPHNWEQGELLTDFAKDPEKEREIVQRTLAKFADYTGRKAKGWLSSSLRGTLQTADILAEAGCIFYCDIMNDDQPYLLRTPHGPIVATPYSNEINDFTFITRKNFTTDQFRDALIEEFDVLYEEGATTGRIMNVGLHPHVSGRAHRVRALRQFIEHVLSKPHVWWPKREEMAAWYLDHHEEHIPGQLGG
jgi:peptidoglycan/xylan/chitin deacetylase (PgdA/CDA1 family)